MAETYEAQLTRVQEAIGRIEDGGQDVTYNGKRVTYGDLKTLYAREQSLLSKIARAPGGGGIRVRGVVPQ